MLNTPQELIEYIYSLLLLGLNQIYAGLLPAFDRHQPTLRTSLNRRMYHDRENESKQERYRDQARGKTSLCGWLVACRAAARRARASAWAGPRAPPTREASSGTRTGTGSTSRSCRRRQSSRPTLVAVKLRVLWNCCSASRASSRRRTLCVYRTCHRRGS